MSKGPFHRSLCGSLCSGSSRVSRMRCCSLLPPVASLGQSLDHFVTGSSVEEASDPGWFRPRFRIFGQTLPNSLPHWLLPTASSGPLASVCGLDPLSPSDLSVPSVASWEHGLQLPVGHLLQFDGSWCMVFLLLPIVCCFLLFNFILLPKSKLETRLYCQGNREEGNKVIECLLHAKH